MFIVKIGCSSLIIMAACAMCKHYQDGDYSCPVFVGVHGEKRLLIMFSYSLLNDQTCSSIIVLKKHVRVL